MQIFRWKRSAAAPHHLAPPAPPPIHWFMSQKNTRPLLESYFLQNFPVVDLICLKSHFVVRKDLDYTFWTQYSENIMFWKPSFMIQWKDIRNISNYKSRGSLGPDF